MHYPARPPYYRGAYRFSKHYFPVIEDLKSKGEEFECAQAIDMNPNIKHWVRNLVLREQASFRLPLAKGYFYPDFIAELNDGRLLVIEYKGEYIDSANEAREKKQVGKIWAEKSKGECLFLWATAKDEHGRLVHQQLEQIVQC